MNASLSKKLLRSTVLHYRQLMDDQCFEQRNAAMCSKLLQAIEVAGCESVHAFLPIKKNREPDITSLLETLWDRGIQVIVSKTDFRSRKMHHFLLERNTILEENRLGIPEPKGAESISLDKVDFVMVPLILADKVGNRIGYGGGFYDQLLSNVKALKVGLSLTYPVDAIHQKEEWDIPLDILITPFKNYQHGKNSPKK
ncbi:MAG: 5-formyltetrahydrofolate cyclo-ligase [Bacteroidota bacterium]